MIRAAILAATLLTPGLAVAEPTAKQLVDAGLATFNVEDYAVASTYFERAFKLEPAPYLLFSWAQSERLGGRCDKARELYTRYLAFELTEAQTQAAHAALDLCGSPGESDHRVPLPPRAAQPAWYSDTLADGLVVGGTAAIVVGAVYLALSSSSHTAAESDMFLDDNRRDLATATSRRRIGITGLALGTALAAAGIGVFVVHRHRVAAGTDGKSVAVSIAW